MTRLNLYCPACGKNSVLVLEYEFTLMPGEVNFACPLCKTKFEVWVEFKELIS